MKNRMLALITMFKRAQRVTCNQCGADLTQENVPRLARKGCPQCGSKLFDYTYPPETAQVVQQVLETRRVRRAH